MMTTSVDGAVDMLDETVVVDAVQRILRPSGAPTRPVGRYPTWRWVRG